MSKKVEDGATVKITYVGTFDDGFVFDSTEKHGGKPLEFIVGKGSVIKGMEEAVIGMEVGEEKEIKIEPKDAYGERDENNVQTIPRDQFPKDQEPKPGMIIELRSKHGDHFHRIMAEIVEVKDDVVKIDMNHPMAGKILNFKIKVTEIN
ncbi:MAG: peptidylprolyl isomerase [Candidatus Lokiarchaeota archaeon]|nr:peptidylprolyl isomerase [Candidatus Lokiarchaeota archaeon]